MMNQLMVYPPRKEYLRLLKVMAKKTSGSNTPKMAEFFTVGELDSFCHEFSKIAINFQKSIPYNFSTFKHYNLATILFVNLQHKSDLFYEC